MKLNGNIENSNFYHVMIRGLAKQIIFEENNDSGHFINLLKSSSENHNIEIICYCLMNNHVHILCQDPGNELPLMMQSLCGAYAKYFNKKYDRVGPLFQGPYRKKLIKNDAQLLQVFRYIINNPEKDGICRYDTYEWSSYRFYNSEYYFTNTSIISSLLGGQNLDNFLKSENSEAEAAPSISLKIEKLTDSQAIEIIKDKYHIKTPTVIRTFEKEKRNDIVIYLRDHGLSIRQIERVSGVSRGITQKILRNSKKMT